MTVFMLCLFIGCLIFRLNCHVCLLVWGFPIHLFYSYCCHVDSVQWLMSLVLCGHAPIILSASQQRLLQQFTVAILKYMHFFFQRRAFQKTVSYLTLLNLDAFEVLKLERRAWPSWCTCLFVERKSCCFVFLRNINSTLVLF